jgi:transcriptional regulator with XRE-family HTH domain
MRRLSVAATQQSIAANIRRRRMALGLTQAELAELASVEPRHLQRLESGKGNPTVSLLVAVSDALGLRPAMLFREAKLPPRTAGRPRRSPAKAAK